MLDKNTSMRVSKQNKTMLNSFKVHSRQTDNEILEILLIYCKSSIEKGDLEIQI